MITTPQEYYAKLHLIQDTNKPMVAAPSDERIYNIDLSTRKIESPDFLSIEKDHMAETIYFTVDRLWYLLETTYRSILTQSSHLQFFDVHWGKILFPVLKERLLRPQVMFNTLLNFIILLKEKMILKF